MLHVVYIVQCELNKIRREGKTGKTRVKRTMYELQGNDDDGVFFRCMCDSHFIY